MYLNRRDLRVNFPFHRVLSRNACTAVQNLTVYKGRNKTKRIRRVFRRRETRRFTSGDVVYFCRNWFSVRIGYERVHGPQIEIVTVNGVQAYCSDEGQGFVNNNGELGSVEPFELPSLKTNLSESNSNRLFAETYSNRLCCGRRIKNAPSYTPGCGLPGFPARPLHRRSTKVTTGLPRDVRRLK